MNSSKKMILCLAMSLWLLPAALNGQNPDQRTLQTKVADILAQFPADNSVHRNRLGNEILSLGETGIAEIANQLVSSGAGKDLAIRYALNAMTVYAAQFGLEPKRALAEKGLLNALASAKDSETKTFLLSQLRLVGREKSVQVAQSILADPDLFEPVTQLLLSIGSHGARQVLLAALQASKDAQQITLVKALGELKVEEANKTLLGWATSTNHGLRKVVLAALAKIGSPDSYFTLSAAVQRASFRYDPANAMAAFLTYAGNLGAKGDLVLCEKACRLVMRNCLDKERLPSAIAALGILAEWKGYDALPDLLLAVDHKDKAYRNAALQWAQKIHGIASARRWIAKAKTAPPEIRTEIISMLGRQNEPYAAPFLQSCLSASEPPIVLAAAEALAHLKKADAAADLLPLLKNRSSEEIPGIVDILLWTLDARHLEPLMTLLPELPPTAKAGAIMVVGAKSGRQYFERILAFTTDTNREVKTAAYGALKNLVGRGDLPSLLQLFESTQDGPLLNELQLALVQAVLQDSSESTRSKPLLEAMKTSSKASRILEILPQIGSTDALKVVGGRFEQSNGEEKEMAFKALVQWKDAQACEYLFKICTTGDPKYREVAFQGFVRQTSLSTASPEQRILQLRKILPYASDTRGKRALIRALERIKTFQSFLVISGYLGDQEIANDAAWATMRVTLPSSAGKDGLSGALVQRALRRVMEILSGPESDYNKENIRKYLESMPRDEGLVALFNGKDLSGWKGLVENPLARAKMSPEELALKQAEADQKVPANWGVRDGMIVFSGKGQNLCTVKEYGDFELLVDWKITPNGDSGIYLRGSPQVQIWDPARTDVGAQVGSGGLYNNQKYESKPLVRADNPVGEWNTLRILMIHEKVTVYLNGVKVADNVVLENYWDRKQPIFPRGAIELQAHGTDLAFRDIYIRELSEKEFNLTEEERVDGFTALFNGRDLNGWTGNKVDYVVDDGTITLKPQPGSRGNLYTEREFSDFQFRFEFLLTPGANNGIGIRTPLEGDAAYVGMEIQILDDTAPIYANLQPYQYHGSVYGIIPAKRGYLKPVGQWNSEEILVRGTHIQVKLNGTLIVEGDLQEASQDGTADHRDHPGLKRASGHIGFLGHGSVVSFRNLRIKDLTPSK